MNWKSTVAASGAMVVATWLASYAPVGSPREVPTAGPSLARTEIAAAQIQREASRLHERLQQAAAYRQPARNPFRFGAPPQPAYAPPQSVVENVAPSEPIAPLPPPFTLSGIAEDTVDDQLVRTAIISGPSNVFLAKVGDEVAGVYKVMAIAVDSVELVRLDNGSALRLALKP